MNNSWKPQASSAVIPPPPRWLLPGFFDGIEDDEVDTTLSLRPPGTTNCHCNNKSSSKPQPSATAIPPPPRWLLPSFFDGVEDDVVDTTLSLRPPSAKAAANNPPAVVINAANQVSSSYISGSTSGKSRKRSRDELDQNKTKRSRGRRNVEENEDDDGGAPLNILMPVPLLQAVESRGGSVPAVFLYRKKLEESDVSRHQNRVFVTRGERVMAFLREEEAAAVVEKGVKMVGVDGRGNVYERLVMKKWASVDMIVINSSDWNKVVKKNNAEKGDFMDIWGYRENGKACLAFNFRKPN